MSSFQVLKVLGNWFPGKAGEVLGMVIFNAGLVLWTMVPLFDTSSSSGRRGRLACYFGLAALGVLVATTIWGYLAL
jgi:hypothetical protein